MTQYYGELRFAGLPENVLRQAILKCHVELQHLGLLNHVETIIETQGVDDSDFDSTDAADFLMNYASDEEE